MADEPEDEPPPLDFRDEDQHQEKEEEEGKSPFKDSKVEELAADPQAPDQSKLEGDGISCKKMGVARYEHRPLQPTWPCDSIQ